MHMQVANSQKMCVTYVVEGARRNNDDVAGFDVILLRTRHEGL